MASYDSYQSYNFDNTPQNVRHTPSSLGWTDATHTGSYNCRAGTRGQEPYLELIPQIAQTPATPFRVYFDPPRYVRTRSIATQLTPSDRHPSDGVFQCQYPGCDRRLWNSFKRQSDLDRHFRSVHVTEPEHTFHCDYPRCTAGRNLLPFTRKDHYREHLRDYHKEDTGGFKGIGKGASIQWFKERIIKHDRWRCTSCLVMIFPQQDGWECITCKKPCETDRMHFRGGYGTGEPDPREAPAEAVQDATYMQSSVDPLVGRITACYTCAATGYPGYVYDGYSQWVDCPDCHGPLQPM